MSRQIRLVVDKDEQGYYCGYRIGRSVVNTGDADVDYQTAVGLIEQTGHELTLDESVIEFHAEQSKRSVSYEQ